MSDIFRVRAIGDTAVLAPLLAQLREAGAVESEIVPTSLVVVGASSLLEADLLLLNLAPKLRRRTVVVGLDEHLDLEATPGSFTSLLDRMLVLGALPADCAARPTITSFIGARGAGDGLARLVGAGFFQLGPSHHKVWCGLPAISAGAFLVRLVRAVDAGGGWFEGPPVRYWSYG